MLPKKSVLNKTSVLHFNKKFESLMLDSKTILLCYYVAFTQLVYNFVNLVLTHQA